MTSGPHPQAGEGRRSQVLRLRERAANPQLGCFPSFVEVDGPRHASCETVSPSNLVRPLCPSILRPPASCAAGGTPETFAAAGPLQRKSWDNNGYMSLDDLQAQLRGALD